jgi:hypothetical protein
MTPELLAQMAELDNEKIRFDAATNNFGLGNESINLGSFMHHLASLTKKSRAVIAALISNDEVSTLGPVVNASRMMDYQLTGDIKTVNWIVMADMIGFKAVGQSAKTMDLVDLMTENMDEVDLCRNSILTTNKELGKYLLDPSLFDKFSPGTLAELSNAKTFIKEYSAMWSGSAGVDRDVFGKLYGSYTQFEKCSDLLYKLTVKFDAMTVKTLQEDMYVLDDTLDKLLNRMASGTTINTSTARKLGDLIYNLADWVAVSALYVTKLIAINTAQLDNVVTINRISNPSDE